EVHATHARIVSEPDLEPMQEDQTGSNYGKVHVSLAGPNPEHIDDDFLAIAYPKVHENLKLITDERVIDNKPESHSTLGTNFFMTNQPKMIRRNLKIERSLIPPYLILVIKQ
ncbi:hypothetical protein Tco_1140548, partial [Tanacetum coccineum]